MKKRDVVVVGGGTIGNYIAFHLAKTGIDVLVNEDNKRIGEPQHCSGLVSIEGLKRIGVWEDIRKNALIEAKIRSARFIDIYGSKSKTISFNQPVAVVIDRIGYDKFLYGLAIDSGAEYMLSSKVLDMKKEGLVKIRNKSSSLLINSDVIVDAEGAKRVLLKKVVSQKLDDGLLPALQIDVIAKKDILEQDTVELHFNVDDFFSWVIPISSDKPIYRVGVASRKIFDHYRIVKDLARNRLGKYVEKRRFGGLVVSSGPINEYVHGKIIVVGDAAGHVKPTTGGGIVFGSIGAFIASRIIKRHLDQGLKLDYYQKYYNGLLSKHYRLMKLVRRTLNFVGVSGAHVLLSLIPQVMFSNIKSDMDLQAEAILKMVLPIVNIFGSKDEN